MVSIPWLQLVGPDATRAPPPLRCLFLRSKRLQPLGPVMTIFSSLRPDLTCSTSWSWASTFCSTTRLLGSCSSPASSSSSRMKYALVVERGNRGGTGG